MWEFHLLQWLLPIPSFFQFFGFQNLYITNLFNLQRYRYVNDTNWYHQYIKLVEQYDTNDDGKVTSADGQENFFAYMSNVDLDQDGYTDKNKLYPERGAYLQPGVYQDLRRFRIGVSISF